MATLALAGIATQLGVVYELGALSTGIITAVGTAAGSYLDGEHLFPGPDIEQPRIGDLRAQAGSEGMPFNYALGPRVRVPGKVVYVGPRFPFVSGGQEFGDFFIDICQGPIESDNFVDEIYANGQLIYRKDASVDITTLLLSYEMAVAPSPPNGAGTNTWYRMRIVSESGGPDLLDLVTGQMVTLGDFADADIDGEWRVQTTFVDSFTPGQTVALLLRNYQVTDSQPSLGSVASGDEVTLTQALDEFSTSTFVNLRQYRGTYTQVADPTIEADYGVGSAPARYGRAGIILEGFNKTKFGGSTPNFEVVFRERESMTVAEAIDELMSRAGFDASDWDSSAISGSFLGITAEEPIDSKILLQSLMMAHRVMAREVEGKLVFYPRDASDVIAVAEADLAAYALGSRPDSRKVSFEDRDDSDLPSRVELAFTNADDGLQQGSAVETHHGLQTFSEEVMRVRTPVTLSEQGAGAMVRQLMLDAYASRQSRATSLPPSSLDISEGDVWTTTVDGEEITSIATRVEMGADGIVRIEGTQEQPHIQRIEPDEVDKEGDVDQGGGEIPLSLYLDLFIWDVAPFDDDQAGRPGLHWGFLDFGASQPYTTGALYLSRDLSIYNNTNEAAPSSLTQFGTVTSSQLTNEATSVNYLDRGSSITVTTFGGWAPASISPAAQEEGGNLAMLGQEVLSWRTATDNGDGTYTLTGLLRGLRGTEEFVPQSGGDTKLLVPISALEFTDPGILAESDFGGTLGWKAVGAGWTEAQVDEFEAVANLGSLVPFRPHNLRATRWEADELHEEDEVSFSWRRQVRRPRPLFSGVAGNDLPENAEVYQIRVFDGLAAEGANSPYTVAGTGDSVLEWTYTPAMASADGFTAAESKTFSFALIGVPQVGAGRLRSVAVSEAPGTYQPTTI